MKHVLLVEQRGRVGSAESELSGLGTPKWTTTTTTTDVREVIERLLQLHCLLMKNILGKLGLILEKFSSEFARRMSAVDHRVGI